MRQQLLRAGCKKTRGIFPSFLKSITGTGSAQGLQIAPKRLEIWQRQAQTQTCFRHFSRTYPCLPRVLYTKSLIGISLESRSSNRKEKPFYSSCGCSIYSSIHLNHLSPNLNHTSFSPNHNCHSLGPALQTLPEALTPNAQPQAPNRNYSPNAKHQSPKLQATIPDLVA